MSIVGGASEEEAKKKFVRKYMCNELVVESHIQEAIDYFSVGVHVYDWHEPENKDAIKGILTSFFTEKVIDSMFDAEKSHALHEFDFKIYTNYS